LIPQNLGKLFKETVIRQPDKKAVLFKDGGQYRSLSWAELNQKVNAVAAALLKQGLKSGDRIAILSENRPEWFLVDMAAQCIGVITVPIYTTLSPVEIQYILSDSQSSLIAVSNKTLFEKLPPIYKNLPVLKRVLAFDSTLSLSQSELSLPVLLMRDFEKENYDDKNLETILEAVPSDAVASIIYTSGTTGVPKGVMLTHSNFIHNVAWCREALKMDATDVHLSFLPLCHVFERTAGYYLMIYIGATIAYAESMDTVAQNLSEVRPTFVLGVPRFYEKIKDKVLAAIEKASSIKKGLFFWAKDIGRRKREAIFDKRPLGSVFKMECALADALVYKKFKTHLGGRVRFCVSGSAPLAKEVAEFFFDLGIRIYEGYGLTETSPVISVNREEKFKFGSVGIPLEEVQVKIAADDEIVTQSACVMAGYYNKPEETKAVLKDGWFYTGDLGALDKEGFLSITGRKKELIVTSGGKKVSPRPVEEEMEKDPFILRCVLFGEAQRFITALVVPREEELIEYAKDQKIVFDSYKNLLKNDTVYRLIEGRVEEHSSHLASFEKIKYFVLLEHDFSQASGELTPTLKVKRDVVLSRYRDELLLLYSKERS